MMAGKPVAVTGDVVATVGTTPFTGADLGTWTAGAVSVQFYNHLTSGGTTVIHQAECTFNFSGTNSGTGATITGSETVTLTAGATVLQRGQSGVLVQGDVAIGTFGNKLEVQTTNVLWSA
jgi:hypothetical protein